jgi:putative SOS response-associated peptidase YedK
MCYSSLVEANLRKLARNGATEKIRRDAIKELLRREHTRINDKPRKIPKWPKALEESFSHPETEEDREIAALFAEHRAGRRTELEAGLFEQRTRLVAAERALKERETAKALNERRIAATKVDWFREQLSDLDRHELKPSDSRIYPFWYTLVIANVDGERVIMPMRYHCRPGGMAASVDRKYPGLYNARRDSLDKFWKDIFGRHHAILVAWAFYENVALEDYERRPLGPGEASKNLVLEFRPASPRPMLLACLWDKWEAAGEEPLYSFSVITDEPPPEVKATGHDRCPIPLKPENLDAWLSPEGRTRESLLALLDDRESLYYEHQQLAA